LAILGPPQYISPKFRAALARVLEIASRRQRTPKRVTIFTDRQAAIRRKASKPGLGQIYVHTPSKKAYRCVAEGQAGYHHRSGGAQRTSSERSPRRSGWRLGNGREAGPPRMPSRQKPDGTVASSSKRLASRFYQLKMLEYIWIDKREDCITVLCGHKISLYTGRPSGQRTEDCPPRAGARGLGHVRTPPHLRMPPLVSHVRTPPHLQTPPYSDKRQATALPGSISSGRRTAPPLIAGSAGTRR